MQSNVKHRPPRTGRGGYGRSQYNQRGERLDAIMQQQGRRYAWLLRQLEQSERPVSRQTFYRARLPEDDDLYINVSNEVWREVARILGVELVDIIGIERESTHQQQEAAA